MISALVELGMPAHFEANDADVVLAAAHPDKAQLIAGVGELLGAREGAVTQHHDAVGAAALEKCVGEKNRVLHPPRRVGRFQAARQLAQPARIGSERHEQARLRPRADDHHLLSAAEPVDQRQPLAPRRVEARHTALLRLHAGAQVDDHDQVSGRGAEGAQPRIGERGDEQERRQELQDQQQVFPQEPAEPGAERTLFQNPLPDEKCRRANLQAARLEALQKEDQRDRSGEQQQCGWKTPEHNSRHAAHLAQRLEHELVERHGGRRAQVVDAAAGAQALRFP